MARTPIIAAGGIVVRDGRTPLIAVVQRRKDDGWVLPKGKLKPREKPIDAARREVIEETGHDVEIDEFLGVISYQTARAPKIAQFWLMRAVGKALDEPMRDIKAVDWLPLAAAIKRLDLPHEQHFLTGVGRRAVARLQADAAAGSPSVSEPIAVETNVAIEDTPSAPVAMADPDPRLNLFGRLIQHLRALT